MLLGGVDEPPVFDAVPSGKHLPADRADLVAADERRWVGGRVEQTRNPSCSARAATARASSPASPTAARVPHAVAVRAMGSAAACAVASPRRSRACPPRPPPPPSRSGQREPARRHAPAPPGAAAIGTRAAAYASMSGSAAATRRAAGASRRLRLRRARRRTPHAPHRTSLRRGRTTCPPETGSTARTRARGRGVAAAERGVCGWRRGRGLRPAPGPPVPAPERQPTCAIRRGAARPLSRPFRPRQPRWPRRS
mmetsp:Transcript_20899/g.53005  ORF Transcript_20899/g.53005 Transcript_20899/m.53005 type:complete len:253 (+) Transcript_20899:487-1245(+)